MMKLRFWQYVTSTATKEFLDEGQRTPGYSRFDALHGYVYGRWPYLYIGIGTGEHWIARIFGPLYKGISSIAFRKEEKNGSDIISEPQELIESGTFADAYHGKVIPLNSATQLVTVNEEIRITDLEKVIPYVKARDLILHNPDQILALECPCRSARENPCMPLDVCLIVGEPFASFVSEHHPNRSRGITQEEAVEILRAEDERGHVHHAFFKDAMLGRFYAICNCCECCCGAMNAHRNGTPMLASSGYLCQIDPDLCIGCGDCIEYCQFNALSLNEYISLVNEDDCMGCGVCSSHCDQGALSLVRDEAKGEPLELCALMSEFG
jgi:ferredoxin